MKGHIMTKVVAGLLVALSLAACSAPHTPTGTMVTPEQTSQKM